MKQHELRPSKGAHKKRKRVARGTAGRGGKTAGRGTKGQNSRSGGSKGPFFEGGQLPFVRRMPQKRGFHNPFRVEYSVVNVQRLSSFRKGSKIDPAALVKAGIIKSLEKPVKVLGQGELEKPLTVSAHKFSVTARNKIEAAGGTVVELD
jgi:large subunit ribosomal protein L15